MGAGNGIEGVLPVAGEQASTLGNNNLVHPMKKFGFILGVVLLAAVLVAGGWILGLQQRVLTEAVAIPTVDRHITEAMVKAMLLHQIDSGRIDDARHHLQSQVEGHILTVDALLDYSDARSRELARKVFRRIAQYREEHPNSYTGRMAHPDADVMAKIDSILRQASTETNQ